MEHIYFRILFFGLVLCTLFQESLSKLAPAKTSYELVSALVPKQIATIPSKTMPSTMGQLEAFARRTTDEFVSYPVRSSAVGAVAFNVFHAAGSLYHYTTEKHRITQEFFKYQQIMHETLSELGHLRLRQSRLSRHAEEYLACPDFISSLGMYHAVQQEARELRRDYIIMWKRIGKRIDAMIVDSDALSRQYQSSSDKALDDSQRHFGNGNDHLINMGYSAVFSVASSFLPTLSFLAPSSAIFSVSCGALGAQEHVNAFKSGKLSDLYEDFQEQFQELSDLGLEVSHDVHQVISSLDSKTLYANLSTSASFSSSPMSSWVPVAHSVHVLGETLNTLAFSELSVTLALIVGYFAFARKNQTTRDLVRALAKFTGLVFVSLVLFCLVSDAFRLYHATHVEHISHQQAQRSKYHEMCMDSVVDVELCSELLSEINSEFYHSQVLFAFSKSVLFHSSKCVNLIYRSLDVMPLIGLSCIVLTRFVFSTTSLFQQLNSTFCVLLLVGVAYQCHSMLQYFPSLW